MSKARSKTPVRAALKADSSLRASVANGLGAVKTSDRAFFDSAVRQDFADSLDLDAALREKHQQENRWDYLLGHAPSRLLVAVEPHSAKQDEITVVIGKRTNAREQLREHLRDGAHITR